VVINGYYINGYWWLFVVISLMVIGGIILMAINSYFISGYWWLLMVIILIIIDGYPINSYW